jgi:hypothetical protein
MSWRESRNRLIATQVGPQLAGAVGTDFEGGSFTTSDQLVAQIGGAAARLNAAETLWSGTLTQIAPGSAYFIQNRVHANGTWTYAYGTGVAASMNDGLVMPTPVITKVPMGKENVKTSSVKTGTVKTANATK